MTLLSSIIPSKARRRVMSLFFLHPEKRFYVRQVCRETGLHINSVRRELSNLEEVGLLSSSSEANLKYYEVERRFPIFSELKRIFEKTENLLHELKELLAGFEIRLAFVYGSFASGEERGSSDIDLVVVGDVPQPDFHRAVRVFEERTGREVSYTIYSGEEFESRIEKSEPFLLRVLDGPKKVLVGEMSEDFRPRTEGPDQGVQSRPEPDQFSA